MTLQVEKHIDESKQGEALNIGVSGSGKKLYLESYGCQMNFSDSEVVAAIMQDAGYTTTVEPSEADLILLNTCAIRDNAEQRIRRRLRQFNKIKELDPGVVIGVLGCMAERIKSQLLEEEKLVDIVVGPDAYRDLPNLLEQADGGQKAVNVLLSREETYAEVSPLRLNSNGVTAFISIMRGCDNMCSFCVVPFTRGRERSRDPKTIVHEAQYLFEQGYREVTLLGQNVDSYRWNLDRARQVIDSDLEAIDFAKLLALVAQVDPALRVRFSTSHPKDMTNDVLEVMAEYDNICKNVHLPVQSGSSTVLARMNRGYSREWYLERISAIRRILPTVGISTDIMTGFCDETEEEHRDTLSLIQEVQFDFAFMYTYSERPKTLAQRKQNDSVPEEIKKARLAEIIEVQRALGFERMKDKIGQVYEVLIEGVSKKSEKDLFGRISQNAVIVFPRNGKKKGDFVNVKVLDCTSGTLIGRIEENID